MRTVHTLATVEMPMPLAQQPPSHTRLRIFGATSHPSRERCATSRMNRPPQPWHCSARGSAPAGTARLLDGVGNAWWHRRRLVLLHLGAGGGPLLRSSVAGSRIPDWLSIERPAVPSNAALRAALRLASDSTGELRVDGTGTLATSWQPFNTPPALGGPIGLARPSGRRRDRLSWWSRPVCGGVVVYRYGLQPVLIDKEQRLRSGSPTGCRPTTDSY
jgi:hypothetical protein